MAQAAFAALNAVTEESNRRGDQRRFVRMPAWMIFYRAGLRKHVGLVRDLNRNGMYFYSDIVPHQGSTIEFVMRFHKWTGLGVVACKGVVLRVDQPVKAAKIGIAVKLTRFFVLS
jgi:hypothetical protein